MSTKKRIIKKIYVLIEKCGRTEIVFSRKEYNAASLFVNINSSKDRKAKHRSHCM